MSVKIKMITPWRYNVLADKVLSAFCTLDDAKRWVSRRGYTYIVDMKMPRRK